MKTSVSIATPRSNSIPDDRIFCDIDASFSLLQTNIAYLKKSMNSFWDEKLIVNQNLRLKILHCRIFFHDQGVLVLVKCSRRES